MPIRGTYPPPSSLPTADRKAEPCSARSRNSTYFDFVRELRSEQEANDVFSRGEVLFVVTISEELSRNFVRGDRPVLLVEADATDPAATSNAIGSLNALIGQAFRTISRALWLTWPPAAAPLICASALAITLRSSPSTILFPA